MFSSQVVDAYVSIEIAVGLVSVGILVLYALYKAVDYLWFCRRLGNNSTDVPSSNSKNPLD